MARPRLVVPLALTAYLRNHVESGAFAELERFYDIRYVLLEGGALSVETAKRYGIEPVTTLGVSWRRQRLLMWFLMLTMYRFSRLARGFRHKMARPPLLMRALYYVLSMSGPYHVIAFAFRRLWPAWPQFAEMIRREKPAAVVMPSLAADPWTCDAIATARSAHVPFVLLVNSWDNLVSKGVVPIAPDRVCVWGEQGLQQAIKVQHIPEERVRALGSPQFEPLFRPLDDQDPEAVWTANGIPRERRIILFAASQLPFDEMGALALLDRAIDDGRLPGYAVLYRPHPTMHLRKGERHFDTYGFRNVFFDATRRERYDSRFRTDGTIASPADSTLPPVAGYTPLLRALTGIVSPLSTMTLEGAVLGKPSVLICYSDGVNLTLSPDKVVEFEHVHDILEFPGITPCFRAEDLVASVQCMLAQAADQKLMRALVDATGYVVDHDERTYAQRLLEVVDELTGRTEDGPTDGPAADSERP